MRTTRLATLFAVAGLLSACSDSPSPIAPEAPARAFAYAGNSQHVVAGTTASDTLMVLVAGTDGAPIANASVSWTVDNSGTLSTASSTTDANGLARTVFSAGTQAGFARISAAVAGIDPVGFELVIDAAAATRIMAMSTVNDTLDTGEAYTGGGVQVSDAFGNAVKNVDFMVTLVNAADEVLSVGSIATDERGVAGMPFLVAPTDAGEYALRFASSDLTLVYRLTVVAPPIAEGRTLARQRP
jgi:hypothetical protein